METVIGLFDRIEDADRALGVLTSQGFSRDQISLVAREQGAQARQASADSQATTTHGGAGAGAGGAVGGVLGLLVGLGALAIPGIGPLVAAGTVGSALLSAAAGAGVGAAAGGMLGALDGMHISRAMSEVYAEGLRRGGVLLLVQTDAGRVAQASDLLRQAGAVDVELRREEWRRAGWGGFDASQPPYDATQPPAMPTPPDPTVRPARQVGPVDDPMALGREVGRPGKADPLHPDLGDETR